MVRFNNEDVLQDVDAVAVAIHGREQIPQELRQAITESDDSGPRFAVTTIAGNVVTSVVWLCAGNGIANAAISNAGYAYRRRAIRPIM